MTQQLQTIEHTGEPRPIRSPVNHASSALLLPSNTIKVIVFERNSTAC